MARLSPLGAKFWNKREDVLFQWVMERAADLQARLLVDGHPPGTDLNEDRVRYDALVQLQAERHPYVLNNPDAQRELVNLSKKFGQAPLLPGSFPEEFAPPPFDPITAPPPMGLGGMP